MKLPKAISPNPILTATVEIRFKSEILNPNNAIDYFFPVFRKGFDSFYDKKVFKPHNVPDVKYLGEYFFAKGNLSMGVSYNSIVFECLGEYPYWSNFFRFIQENLDKIQPVDLGINLIERIGLRYTNILRGVKNSGDATKISISHFNENLSHIAGEFKSVSKLNNSDIQIILQISEHMNGKQNDENINGLYIDIDAFVSEVKYNNFSSEICEKIDILHREEKKLFFTLLNESYLKTLKIEY